MPKNELHRIIDIFANAPFMALHDVIYEAFDRYDPHLCKFLLTRTQAENLADLYDFPEKVADVAFEQDFGVWDEEHTVHDWTSHTIADAARQEKDSIYYWFDFGDDWMHHLQVEKIFQIDDPQPKQDGYTATVIEKVGESPEQYDEDSIWMDEEVQESMSLMTGANVRPGPKHQPDMGGTGRGRRGRRPVGTRMDCPPSDDDPVEVTDAGRAAAATLAQMIDEMMKQSK